MPEYYKVYHRYAIRRDFYSPRNIWRIRIGNRWVWQIRQKVPKKCVMKGIWLRYTIFTFDKSVPGIPNRHWLICIICSPTMESEKRSNKAIASERAAKIYGLSVLNPQLNVVDNNTTRFVIVSNKKEYVKDADKVSISFSLPHTCGTLYNILAHSSSLLSIYS